MARTRLNCQALARRSPELMQCIIPDEQRTTVSIDLASGEPTVTAHHSRDKNYLYACFEGVGKAPYYNNSVLMIDDPYLMCMSVSPVGAHIARAAFDKQWPAGSFQDQWLADAEVIKQAMKKDRQIHKILALGLSYGMGAKKMVKQMYDSGYILSLADAKKFKASYWNLFSGVKQFSDRMGKIVQEEGYLVNPFGFRLVTSPHKAFNAFIQSSVSGVMNVFTAKLMAKADYAYWVTCVHDELIVDVPSAMLEQFRSDKDLATDSLNDDLKWVVNIRTGFAPGPSWYEAK